MGKKDPRIDKYISTSADFARPILTHLRKLVHHACPEVEEDLKWGMPHFMYKGMLCSMAAFKNHCAFGFWKEALIFDKHGEKNSAGAGQFGRITAASDLPSDKILLGYVRKAAKLNEAGIKSPVKSRKTEKKELEIPEDLAQALRKNRKAAKVFEEFSFSNKREYVEWLIEAKSEETRLRRLGTAIEWMSEGKVRNWKYIKK